MHWHFVSFSIFFFCLCGPDFDSREVRCRGPSCESSIYEKMGGTPARTRNVKGIPLLREAVSIAFATGIREQLSVSIADGHRVF